MKKLLPSANNHKPPNSKFKTIVDRYSAKREKLISMLHDIQEEFRYLPEESLRSLSNELSVPLIKIYGIATFYKSFRLKRPGRHMLTVCLGTACHVRGGPRIADEISRVLDVKPGETTKDGEYSLETVNCLGCCAIGPVLVMDGKIFGQITTKSVKNILKQTDKDRNKKEGVAG
ncbi:MAG: NAD(P)H-dependent oxidoreductase subunit E [Elusimicrobia bacterium]|nr:NAD(P)H-dependent oxidoreductase subunit E [Elusimicrobiota bacterium]